MDTKEKNLSQSSIEETFTQIEWQNIYFSEIGVDLDANKLLTRDFYNKFYKELFNRYENYEALPESWLEIKKDTAINILNEMSGNEEVLSYGCGIGYVENITRIEA